MSELSYKNTLPVLPLREIVVFPMSVISLYVGRALSIAALEEAKENGHVFLAMQKEAKTENPTPADIYPIGCVAKILQMLKMPDDSYKILVEGIARAKAEYTVGSQDNRDCMYAVSEDLPMGDKPAEMDSLAMIRVLRNALKNYARFAKKNGDELWSKANEIDDLTRLLDLIANSFPMPNTLRQQFLEMTDYQPYFDKLLKFINKESDVKQLEKKIRGRVKNQVEKNHREYYLQEQMRALQKEMGDDHNNELEEFKKRLEKAGMPQQARQKAEQELKKLRLMSPMSAEATVARAYLDTLLSLPWDVRSDADIVAAAARRQLDTDHDGLEKIKEHIMEYLAVQKRVPNSKAPVLCFVGPPGVGKTSLGRSIAQATGRVFGRISLGGVRDEAEIRGHRRTYIGSMPGKIINTIIRAKTKNPLILLDEIDKMGYDFRGDPSAALLEVLDKEQNNAFADHYVEVDFDLSEVMFVTTANTMNIPPALMDRLEIIRLSGYTEEEKICIAENHLIPRQFKESGLSNTEAKIRTGAVRDIIRCYTREAGVRNLERNIGRICRRIVLQAEEMNDKAKKRGGADADDSVADDSEVISADIVAENGSVIAGDDNADGDNGAAKESGGTDTRTKHKVITVTPTNLKKFLGVRRFHHTEAAKENRIGQVNGLAWTEVGGDLLSVEACHFIGKGNIIRTGKLGEVIKESVETAFSVIRTHLGEFNLPPAILKSHDFHIHFPEGAIPKDGPSAGIAIATAVLSVISGIAVRSDIAMTGEITLRGEVLPIGGVKEKLLAALRADIHQIILPKENEKDLAEIPANIKSKLNIHLVKWIDEVFALALVKMPKRKRKVAADKIKTKIIPPTDLNQKNPPLIRPH